MPRTIFSLFLLFQTLAASAQQSTIPASIQVPTGHQQVADVWAKGVQVYTCTKDPKDATHYTWVFKEPRAKLYADSADKEPMGKHYFDAGKNPTWELADGSKVSGVKVQANAPDSTAIPWLLLKTTEPGGGGIFTRVKFIQRIHTRGGMPTATATAAKAGKTIEVPYTAEYIFWEPK